MFGPKNSDSFHDKRLLLYLIYPWDSFNCGICSCVNCSLCFRSSLEGRRTPSSATALVLCRRQRQGQHASEDRRQPQEEEGWLWSSQDRSAKSLLHSEQTVVASGGIGSIYFDSLPLKSIKSRVNKKGFGNPRKSERRLSASLTSLPGKHLQFSQTVHGSNDVMNRNFLSQINAMIKWIHQVLSFCKK